MTDTEKCSSYYIGFLLNRKKLGIWENRVKNLNEEEK